MSINPNGGKGGLADIDLPAYR